MTKEGTNFQPRKQTKPCNF